MLISRLIIKNFRSIKNSEEITLTKLFAFIGKNNTGKSAILKALQVFWGKIEAKESDFHKNKVDENIEIEVFFKNYNDEKYKNLFLDKDGNEIEETKIKITISKDSSSGKLKEEFLLNDVEKSSTIRKNLPKILIIPDIRNPEKESTAGAKTYLKDLIDQIESQSSLEQEKQRKIEEVKNIIIKDIQDISKLTTENIQNILGDKCEVLINPSIDISKAVSYETDLIFGNIEEGNRVKLLSCGTGIQSIFILALLETYAQKNQYSDEILLIEEPEVYLHPELQRKMFKTLRNIADANQVIFTTHSPIMISEVWATESIRQVSLNDEGETIISQIKIEEVIDELGIRYEDILNPSLILFVEGDNDEKFFKNIGINNPKIKFINSDGLRAIHYFAYIKILTSDSVKNNFRIIADSDGLDSLVRHAEIEGSIRKEFKRPITINLDEKITVLPEYAPESYFLKTTILSKSFPKIKKEDIENFVDTYKQEYTEQRKIKNLTIERNRIDFQIYFNPKRIFEDFKKNNKKYDDFWRDKGNFLEVRKQIRKDCDHLKINKDKSHFDHIFENIDVEKDLPEELIVFKNEILKLLVN
ncbi:MAG: hypothetical protein A2175_00445 [Candidatus Nealsonbacteria bacterium RBG_13_42_11]|uniref:Endonuclease GajA/Old nuclease/RecF-like AAA domain-containing protein n=1 Tax=Candidatus Nealsonbacteria bacterium RBG_13_42_11 TaxID=1801663 RepID=A0A1G2DYZ8_9BACT|nr:MAG: hypothetical protein A2175_00445 [Candidatus Nealsonbacteria bacterium RBG_13_42_11]